MTTRLARPALALVILVLAQLACQKSEEATLQSLCEQEGGTWHAEPIDPLQPGWCEMPDPPTAEPVTSASCVAPAETLRVTYSDLQRSSGTGGVACRANFVFENLSAAPVHLIVRTLFNNNAMDTAQWEQHLVPAGGDWSMPVNRTDYVDGVVTYNTVVRWLAIRDVPECAFLLPDDNELIWGDLAETVEDFTCD